jgi:hypothetical protein
LLPIIAEHGYVIPAFGDIYVKCASKLRDSILEWHPNANICILTEDMLSCKNHIGQANDWQCYWLSPYRHTIKLEADMWCASPIDHWWDLFTSREVVISQGCRDFYDQTGKSRYYRKIFDDNYLPDVYNAITYWQVSGQAEEFFNCVRNIFENWEKYRTLLKFPDEVATTDVVYAMAAVIMGVENVTLPAGPTIVHMKKNMIPIVTEDWSKELVYEHTAPGVRINTVAQWGFVHYHIKELANEQ